MWVIERLPVTLTIFQGHAEFEIHPDDTVFRLAIHPQTARSHPAALAGKWDYAAEIARSISVLLPDNPFGHFHLAFSLHELKRTKEAYDVLIAVVDKFPAEHLIRYNLACYSCRLGRLKEAYQWLEKAIDLAGKEDIRQTALDDSDLEPLWAEIGEI
jgi:tetratricopeptide (TPR) repeat protein